jgi:hypothetical protein
MSSTSTMYLLRRARAEPTTWLLGIALGFFVFPTLPAVILGGVVVGLSASGLYAGSARWRRLRSKPLDRAHRSSVGESDRWNNRFPLHVGAA